MSEQKSKTALLEYKKDLLVIQSGQEILEQKRNILLNEIMKILDSVNDKREKLNELVEKSYSLLIKAFMENDRDTIEKEAELISFKGDLKVIEKNFIGIAVPVIDFKIQKDDFPISAITESLFLDVAKQSFTKALELILELAQIEIKAWKLSQELKKTVVRVNALTNYYLPHYEDEIKQIQNLLEESEREFLTILKRI